MEEVRAAVSKFYLALNQMFTGDLELMNEVWSHSDDVTYMGPTDGLLVGWEQVAPLWEKQAALMLGGKVEATQMHITVGSEIAVTCNYEEGENAPDGGEVQRVKIRATNVFRKEDGVWKMIGHHTDLLPFLSQ